MEMKQIQHIFGCLLCADAIRLVKTCWLQTVMCAAAHQIWEHALIVVLSFVMGKLEICTLAISCLRIITNDNV